MCGITGILTLDGSPAKRETVEKMNGTIAHRGPDGHGFFVDGPVGLGHRRLSIIDLESGSQPMRNGVSVSKRAVMPSQALTQSPQRRHSAKFDRPSL